MRSVPRPWLAVVAAILALAACSSEDDEPLSSASDTVAPTSAPAATTSSPPATTDDLPSDEAIRDQALDVLTAIAGQIDLDPAEEECILDAVLTDDELRRAVDQQATLDALPAETRSKAIDAVVGCAPRAVASAAIGTIGLDIDQERRTCIEDGFAAEPQLLGDLAETALTLDGGGSVDAIPSDLVLDVLGLLQRCGVSLTDLS